MNEMDLSSLSFLVSISYPYRHSPYGSLHAFHSLMVPSSLAVPYILPSGE